MNLFSFSLTYQPASLRSYTIFLNSIWKIKNFYKCIGLLKRFILFYSNYHMCNIYMYCLLAIIMTFVLNSLCILKKLRHKGGLRSCPLTLPSHAAPFFWSVWIPSWIFVLNSAWILLTLLILQSWLVMHLLNFH